MAAASKPAPRPAPKKAAPQPARKKAAPRPSGGAKNSTARKPAAKKTTPRTGGAPNGRKAPTKKAAAKPAAKTAGNANTTQNRNRTNNATRPANRAQNTANARQPANDNQGRRDVGPGIDNKQAKLPTDQYEGPRSQEVQAKRTETERADNKQTETKQAETRANEVQEQQRTQEANQTRQADEQRTQEANQTRQADEQRTQEVEQTRETEQRQSQQREEERRIADMQQRYADDTRRLAQENEDKLQGVVAQSFGDKVTPDVAQEVTDNAKQDGLPQPANVRFADAADLNGNQGAYIDKDGGTVLLDRALQNDSDALDRVYREEAGHHLDRELGGDDAVGDEGELFAQGLEEGAPIDEARAERIRQDNDHGQLQVDGETVDAEFREPGGRNGAGFPGGQDGGFGGQDPGGQDFGRGPGQAGFGPQEPGRLPGDPNGRPITQDGLIDVARDGLPPAAQDLLPERGGFPKHVGGRDGGTPTPEQVQDAVRYMDQNLRIAQNQMQDAVQSGDPQRIQDAFSNLRTLDQGAEALRHSMEHVAAGRGITFGTANSIESLRQESEEQVLQHTAQFIQSLDPSNPNRPSATGWNNGQGGGNGVGGDGGGGGEPGGAGGSVPEQADLDYLAQLSVGTADLPPGTPMGPESMSHKMWDRLQADAQKPGNEALKARLDAAAEQAGQTAERSRATYERALFADNPQDRQRALSELEQTGSLFYGRHMDSLRAADPMLSLPDQIDEPAAMGYQRDIQRLANNGNVFAQDALQRLGDDFENRYGSDDPEIADRAREQLAASRGYLKDINDTDRVDFALQNVDTHSSLSDLTKARERLDTEIKRDNQVAAGLRDRVAVQEELTGLAQDRERIDGLRERSDAGDEVARRTLTEVLDATGRSRNNDEPVALGRGGHDAVHVPDYGREDRTRFATQGAQSLGENTSRSEAFVLGQAVDREGAGPDVRRAAERSLQKGIAEENEDTLRGMTDAMLETGNPGSKSSYSRLGRTFNQARDMEDYPQALNAVGEAAAHGNLRAMGSVSRELALDENHNERDEKLADIAEKHLTDAAKGGYAPEVTKELLFQTDGGHGDQFYRTLGTAAAKNENLNRQQRDDVMSHLSEGLTRGGSRTEHKAGTAHEGAADGMAEMVDHFGKRQAMDMALNLSPDVVDALEKMAPDMSKAQGDAMMLHLRSQSSGLSRESQDVKNLAARGIGKLGRFADQGDVRSLVSSFGKLDDNRAGFDGVVNILSRTDSPQVRDAAVHALMDDKNASWNNLKGVDQDTKQRLVDYVTGSGDWELQSDIGKLLDGTNIRPPLPGLMNRYGIDGTKDEIINKTLEARGHYGDSAVRNLGANAAQWNRLTPDLRQELLGWGDRELSDADRTLLKSRVDTAQSAELMAKGTLHDSPNKFLLDDLGGKTEGLLAEQRKAGDKLEQELRTDRAHRDKYLEGITGQAQEGLGFSTEAGHVLSYLTGERLISGEKTEREHRIDGQNAEIRQLEKLDTRLQEKAMKISEHRRKEMFLDTAQAGFERESLIAEGRQVDADKVSFEQWNKHGELLEQLDPQMYNDLHRDDDAAGARGDGGWARLHNNDEFHLNEAPKYSDDADARYKEATEVLGGEVKGAERSAVVKDAMRVIDQDESSQHVMDAAGVLSRELPTVQSMLQAGANGGAFDDYVNNVRGRSQEVLTQLDNLNRPEVREQIEGRIDQLKKLEENMAGHPSSETREVTSRRESLEKMMALSADDSELRNMLGTVMDESKFRADTWENWAKYEGPKVASAIGMGVVAAGATASAFATFGATAPLAAVALAGAAGGLVGNELGAEAVHYYQNNFDADVTSGRTSFSARSKLGHKMAGDQIRDAESGKMRDRTWGGDVALPYAKELSTNFAISYATMGLGKVLGNGINKTFGESVNKMLGRGQFADDLASIGGKLGPLEGAMGREGLEQTFAEAMKQGTLHTAKEFGEEVVEESAEHWLQKGLDSVDKRLGALSGLILSTGSNVNLNVDTKTGDIQFDGDQVQAAIEGYQRTGYDVALDPNQPGRFSVRDGDLTTNFAGQGDVPTAEQWAQIQAAQPAETAPLPDAQQNDPGVLRERAFAQRQLARRYEQGLLDGQIPEGMTEATANARVEQLRANADRMENRAEGGPHDATNVRDATGVADADNPAAEHQLAANNDAEIEQRQLQADNLERQAERAETPELQAELRAQAEKLRQQNEADAPVRTVPQLQEDVRQRQVALDNEQRRLEKTEEAYIRELEKQEELMGERFNGKKPPYTHAAHHDPTMPGEFRGRGDATTHIPPNAEELYRNAIPDPESNGRTWWSRDEDGNYHRFQATQAGTDLHWNGATGEPGGARAMNERLVPSHVRQRMRNQDNIEREEARLDVLQGNVHSAERRLDEAQGVLDRRIAEPGDVDNENRPDADNQRDATDVDDANATRGGRYLPQQGLRFEDYPRTEDGNRYALPTDPKQRTPEIFLNESLLPAMREIKNKDGSLRYPDSVAQLERLSQRMERAAKRGHNTRWNQDNASYNRRLYNDAGDQIGSLSSINVRTVHDFNHTPGHHPYTDHYMQESAGRFAEVMTHELAHGNASNAADRAFDPRLGREENIQRMHQAALADEASRVRNGYAVEQHFAREAAGLGYTYTAATNEPMLEQGRREFEKGGSASVIQQRLIDHIADNYIPSTNPDTNYRQQYRRNAERNYERMVKTNSQRKPNPDEQRRINNLQDDLQIARKRMVADPVDGRRAVEELRNKPAWRDLKVQETKREQINEARVQSQWDDIQRFHLSEGDQARLAYEHGRNSVYSSSETYNGQDGTVRYPSGYDIARPNGMPDAVYNEYVRGVNDRHHERTLDAHQDAARALPRRNAQLTVAMDPITRDAQPLYGELLQRHQQAPLTNGERQQVQKMGQDLQRAHDLAAKDPQAALQALRELHGKPPWNNLDIDHSVNTNVPVSHVARHYQDIQDVAKEHPDMSVEEVAYEVGRAEQASRLTTYYNGRNESIEVPGIVKFNGRPDNMPQPVYDALLRGMNASHAERVVGAYRSAAERQAREGARLNIPMGTNPSTGPLPAAEQPTMRGMPVPKTEVAVRAYVPPANNADNAQALPRNPTPNRFQRDASTGAIRVERGNSDVNAAPLNQGGGLVDRLAQNARPFADPKGIPGGSGGMMSMPANQQSGRFLVTGDIKPGQLPYANGVRPIVEGGVRTPPTRLEDFPQVKLNQTTDIVLASNEHSGSSAVVKLAELPDGRPVAARVLPPWEGRGNDPERDAQFVLEAAQSAQLMSDLGLGPKFHGMTVDQNGWPMMVTDVATGDFPTAQAPGSLPAAGLNGLDTMFDRMNDAGLTPAGDFQYFVDPQGGLSVIDIAHGGNPATYDRHAPTGTETSERMSMLLRTQPQAAREYVEGLRTNRPRDYEALMGRYAIALERDSRHNLAIRANPILAAEFARYREGN